MILASIHTLVLYTGQDTLKWSNIYNHYPDTVLIVYPSSYGQDVDLYENHSAHDNTIDDIIRIPRLPSSADILHTVQNASCQKRDRSLFPYTFFSFVRFHISGNPPGWPGPSLGSLRRRPIPLGKDRNWKTTDAINQEYPHRNTTASNPLAKQNRPRQSSVHASLLNTASTSFAPCKW